MIYTVTLNPALDRELTVSALEPNCVLRATHSRLDTGGKGFNVSRAVEALGRSTIALGFAGGKTGEMLYADLHDLGIPTDFVWIADETRTNTSIVCPTDNRYFKVNESGPEIKSAELAELERKVQSHVAAGDYWVLAGSLPNGVPATIYADMITWITAAGAHAVLDASGAALQAGLDARPYLVKPNSTEATALTGYDDPQEAALAIRQMGAENVIVSLGADGALLATAAGIERVASPPIQEVNPIGAGDAMVAGVVWALDAGHTLPEALRWGVCSGAAAAAQAGTGVGTRAAIESLMQTQKE